MQVWFQIPGPLREFTENQSTVRVELGAGANLLQALQELFITCPGLRDRVLTKQAKRGETWIYLLAARMCVTWLDWQPRFLPKPKFRLSPRSPVARNPTDLLGITGCRLIALQSGLPEV